MPNKLALKTKISFGIIILLIPIIIFLSLKIGVRKYYFISVVVMLLALISFCLAFENRKPKAHEIITIAVMCAIAVVG
ncbi:MAG: ECF transporter S component, partial [Oscillospiraceae bacterium]